MKREAQAVVFLVLGAVLLKLVVSGEYTNYVRSVLRPYLIVAGLVLMVLGILGFVRDWLGRGALERAESLAAQARVRTHGPGAGPTEPAPESPRLGHLVGWLWIVPVFVLVLVPPPALGSFAAERGAATVPRPAQGLVYRPLAGPDPVTMEVNDYARRAIWNGGKTLTGHTIRLTGFVTPHNGGGWYLTRMKVSCCAADARPFQVEILGYATPLPRDTWVRVTGTWVRSAGTEPATAVARMKISVLDQISTPSQPYD